MFKALSRTKSSQFDLKADNNAPVTPAKSKPPTKSTTPIDSITPPRSYTSSTRVTSSGSSKPGVKHGGSPMPTSARVTEDELYVMSVKRNVRELIAQVQYLKETSTMTEEIEILIDQLSRLRYEQNGDENDHGTDDFREPNPPHQRPYELIYPKLVNHGKDLFLVFATFEDEKHRTGYLGFNFFGGSPAKELHQGDARDHEGKIEDFCLSSYIATVDSHAIVGHQGVTFGKGDYVTVFRWVSSGVIRCGFGFNHRTFESGEVFIRPTCFNMVQGWSTIIDWKGFLGRNRPWE